MTKFYQIRKSKPLKLKKFSYKNRLNFWQSYGTQKKDHS
jgi:hypothetical protein